MKPFLVLILGTIVAVNLLGQGSSKSKKPVVPKKPGQPSFTCPDPEAKQGCKSYKELLQAKDPGLPNEEYVCFRKGVDEFFAVTFTPPFFGKHWDADSKRMVVDQGASSNALGSARTYKDGVENSGVMPNLFFEGEWHSFGDSGIFVSKKVYPAQDSQDNNSVISINASQFSILKYQFKNSLGQTLSYELTIQLSTGRFSESFLAESKQVPLAENSGRCVHIKNE